MANLRIQVQMIGSSGQAPSNVLQFFGWSPATLFSSSCTHYIPELLMVQNTSTTPTLCCSKSSSLALGSLLHTIPFLPRIFLVNT